MSLFCRTGTIHSATVSDVGTYAFVCGFCTLTMAGALNDIYCAHILKNKQTLNINMRFSNYNAKYTKIFLVLATLSGVCIGGRFGYTKKALWVNY